MSAAPDARARPPAARVPRLPWPAPALLTWMACWAMALALLPACAALDLPPAGAWGAGATLGVGLAMLSRAASRWRRVFMALGFPVSALASGLAGAMPAWAWLLPLGLLLAAYPLRAWRDAPLFPTPADALLGLAQAVPLPAGARVMDAGCGLGHGLWALRRSYPQARLEGVEFSRMLWAAAALRCRWARLRRGDMWAADWSGLAMVYLFQRPESMARALAKADADMAPGSWLVSLDFPVPGVAAAQVLRRPGAQAVWVYRVGGPRPAPSPAGSTPGGTGR